METELRMEEGEELKRRRKEEMRRGEELIIHTLSGMRRIKEEDLRLGLWERLAETRESLVRKESEGTVTDFDKALFDQAIDQVGAYLRGEVHEYSDWAKAGLKDQQKTRGLAAET